MRNSLANPTEPLPAAILFDCDGTLLLAGELHFNAISAAFANQGQRLRRDWYRALTGLGRRDLFARYAADFGVPLDIDRLAAESIALTLADEGSAKENPSVADLARRASGRLPIAVVTNSEGAIVHALLRETALHDIFDRLVGCEEAKAPKPAPDLYVFAARSLGVFASDRLVIEDSDQGISAAKAAGMRCLDVRQPDWPMACRALLELVHDRSGHEVGR